MLDFSCVQSANEFLKQVHDTHADILMTYKYRNSDHGASMLNKCQECQNLQMTFKDRKNVLKHFRDHGRILFFGIFKKATRSILIFKSLHEL